MNVPSFFSKFAHAPIISPALLLFACASVANASEHGLSLVGEVKYADGFAHFDYVNPDAPRGGSVTFASSTPYDSFNHLIPQGISPSGLALIYDTLMTPSSDEISSQYGLIARSVTLSDDAKAVTFHLREEARWHDGVPITAADVAFSFNEAIRLSPLRAQYYADVHGVEVIDDHTVTFRLSDKTNRELPYVLGQIQVLPKHFWEGVDEEGQPRSLDKITLAVPLGSGPYKVSDFQAGRYVHFDRVPEYWGQTLNVNVGRHNFDRISYRYYIDHDAAFDAFKRGDADWRDENIARQWAEAYAFPDAQNGNVVKETFPVHDRGLMQAFIFNLRHDKFKDIRVRKAFNRIFNFEAMNKAFFFEQYERISSYFFPTELASSGLPEGRELEILKAVESLVPPTVFTEVFENPVFVRDSDERVARREALALLREAGWTLNDAGKLVDGSGEPFTLEFMIYATAFEKIALFYIDALSQIGIDASVRLMDPSRYVERVNQRDFDMVIMSYAQTLSPGNEQLSYWGSQDADLEGSQNHMGIKDAAIDYLIENLLRAPSYDELIYATRALDRVLLHNHFLVPHWSLSYSRTARWNRFSRPELMPEYGASAFPSIWWYDEDKAASLK